MVRQRKREKTVEIRDKAIEQPGTVGAQRQRQQLRKRGSGRGGNSSGTNKRKQGKSAAAEVTSRKRSRKKRNALEGGRGMSATEQTLRPGRGRGEATALGAPLTDSRPRALPGARRGSFDPSLLLCPPAASRPRGECPPRVRFPQAPPLAHASFRNSFCLFSSEWGVKGGNRRNSETHLPPHPFPNCLRALSVVDFDREDRRGGGGIA